MVNVSTVHMHSNLASPYAVGNDVSVLNLKVKTLWLQHLPGIPRRALMSLFDVTLDFKKDVISCVQPCSPAVCGNTVIAHVHLVVYGTGVTAVCVFCG